jgi:hypothetical protein
MSNYRFTQTERQAVFTVHGEKCYMCNASLTMKTVEVDHVVPESLADDPEEFARVRLELGLPIDFDVNTYENWLPSCRPCNGAKRATVWRPSLLVQLALQRASERAPRAREVAQTLVSDKRIAAAVAVLESANEQGELSDDVKEGLRPLVQEYVRDRTERSGTDGVRVTPDYTVPLYEVVGDNGLTVVVRGPYGTGGGPSGDASPEMRCSSCGLPYFNGARCVICGTMDDD